MRDHHTQRIDGEEHQQRCIGRGNDPELAVIQFHQFGGYIDPDPGDDADDNADHQACAHGTVLSQQEDQIEDMSQDKCAKAGKGVHCAGLRVNIFQVQIDISDQSHDEARNGGDGDRIAGSMQGDTAQDNKGDTCGSFEQKGEFGCHIRPVESKESGNRQSKKNQNNI